MAGSARRAAGGSARRRRPDGAAAVEFALVGSIFFLLLFGIIQYGLYFNDSLNTRQGIREAARQAAVENFGYMAGCTTGSSSAQLLCSTRKDIGALTGTPKVRVSATPWGKGSAVVVCAMVKSDGAIGLLPMPGGGWITSRTQMYIEQETKKASWVDAEDSLAGTGQTWGWCT